MEGVNLKDWVKEQRHMDMFIHQRDNICYYCRCPLCRIQLYTVRIAWNQYSYSVLFYSTLFPCAPLDTKDELGAVTGSDGRFRCSQCRYCWWHSDFVCRNFAIVS